LQHFRRVEGQKGVMELGMGLGRMTSINYSHGPAQNETPGG